MKLEWTRARSAILFGGGLLGVTHETLLAATERPSLLIVFTTMMGLPAFIGKDEKKRSSEDSEEPKG